MSRTGERAVHEFGITNTRMVEAEALITLPSSPVTGEEGAALIGGVRGFFARR